LEKTVMDAIVNAFHPDTWEGFVNDLCDIKLADLHNLYRGNPVKVKERLAGRIEDLKAKISRAQDLYIDNKLSRSQYDEKESNLQEEIEVVEQELSKVDNLDAEVHRVEYLRRALLCIENPLSGNYVFLMDDDSTEDLMEIKKGLPPDYGLPTGYEYGSEEVAAKRRQDFYRKVGMLVKVGKETLEISLGVDKIIVCNNEGVSGVTAAPAPVGVPGSLSRPLS
jgi:hypothetical protein